MRSLLLLSLAGCLETWDGGTLSPVSDHAAWADEVQVALDQLQAAVGPDCLVPFSVGEGGYPVRLYHPSLWPYAEDEVGKYTGEEIGVRGTSPTGKWHIVLHELGHALGLDHTEQGGDVMSTVPYPRFNDPLIARFRDGMGCT